MSAGLFRIVLMPIDALKTIMQVEGKNGAKMLALKIKTHGPSVLFHGALGAMSATMSASFSFLLSSVSH